MGRIRIVARRVASKPLKQLGLAIERAYGIKPLAKGEVRPEAYYTPNHYLARGRPPMGPVLLTGDDDED